MIRKTILAAFVLFCCYSIFVAYLAPASWTASQHQWQDNVIKAQKFVYTKDSFDNVIIGTSLSCRIIMDSIPKTYNLSFQGQSIYEGLEILKHKSVLPKNVFIEMNVVLREEDKNFTGDLYAPTYYYSKKVLKSLREDKQPLAILGAKINAKITSRFLGKIKSFLNLDEKNSVKNANKELLAKLLVLQIKDNSNMPDMRLLNRCFRKLKTFVINLQKRGVNIVFFEMPVNSVLHDLKKPSIIRSSFYQNFSPAEYTYIPIPDSLKFETADGIHLNKEDALIYTGYFKSKIKGYLR